MVYPTPTVLANPVNSALVFVELVGLILVGVPSISVIWKVYGSKPLVSILTEIVPSAALKHVTSVNASIVGVGGITAGSSV